MSSRRDFFRSIVGRGEEVSPEEAEEVVVRPPYAIEESLFLSRCIECTHKACATSCEEEIIVIKADGTPTLNFTKRGCTFCEECANVCEAGVLALEKGIQKINVRFSIETQSCLSHNGVICFSCKEPCIDDAILFAGMFNPVIDDGKCTECGYCMARCPVRALVYEPVPIATYSKSDNLDV
jgi:ferredoxin-type protein NapF